VAGCEHGDESSNSLKGDDFLEQLSCYKLLKVGCSIGLVGWFK
jgi:hypothetical protein